MLAVLSTLGAPGGMRALAMADGPTFYRYVSMMEGGAAISPPSEAAWAFAFNLHSQREKCKWTHS